MSVPTIDPQVSGDVDAAAIAALIEAAPEMTPEQRDKIRRIYRYGPAEDDAR